MTKKRIKSLFSRKKIKKVAFYVVAALFLFGGITALWISTFKIPTLETFEERKVAQSTKIFDKTGEIVLYDVFQDIKRTVVPFESISSHIKNATISIEDREFYTHKGIKPSSILRAVLVNAIGLNFSQGGSTITQQVVKNSVLTKDKTISRKLKEWVLAMKLEKIMNKEEIFSLYLNEIPYGGNIYGVEEASQAFFGKKSSDVTIAEAAYIAALPQAPTFYSPYGKNIDKLNDRKNLVLYEMKQNGFITDEEYAKAKEEKVVWRPREELGIKAPHFVFFVIKQLEEKYGEDILQNGGLKVVTTLDYELQKTGEELAKKHALENKNKFNAENVSLVAIDPKTGGILTMVGSRDYFDEEIDGNFNIATAHRQPGSAFKPFAYASAFSKGFTPETVLFDVETEFSTACSPQGVPLSGGAVCYKPVNYDNIYRGPVSMRNALAQSINVPAIKTLYLAGTENVLRLAKNMGVGSLEGVNRYGLTLVLGGGEVSLLDMTGAYGVFANNGVRNPYFAITEIKDKDGKSIEKHNSQTINVLEKNVALSISDILSDNVARTPAFGERSYLYFPQKDVAVKTGTTNDYKDAWIIGYTPNIAVGAWAGNNNNSPMEKKVAGFIIAPFWNAFMTEALKKLPNEPFEKPIVENSLNLKPILRGKWQGDTSYLIDKVSGKLATEHTPEELLQDVVVGEIHSILHVVDKENPRGDAPNKPSDDPQYRLWEYAVQKWLKAHNIKQTTKSSIPTELDDIHTPENKPKISFVNPQEDGRYKEKEKIDVVLKISGKYPVEKIEYYLNNEYLGNSSVSPYLFSFIPSELELDGTNHNLKVVVYDIMQNKSESDIDIRITNR